MIGLKLPNRKRARDEAEKPFWISFADLMTALMVLFLVAVTVALFAVTQKEAIKQKQRNDDIQTLLNQIEEAAKAYPGIKVQKDKYSIDFGTQALFQVDSHQLTNPQANTLRDFVPHVLSVARNPLGQKWLKSIVVEGFASQGGTYLHNLNLSLQRSERVLCVLLDTPQTPHPGNLGWVVSNPLSVADRLLVRDLFFVGGSSFNALKPNPLLSQRIELKLEFLGLDEPHTTPRNAPLDGAACPL
jgi:outer membrane protein OmpA-like peptidoglycan-associated protein